MSPDDKMGSVQPVNGAVAKPKPEPKPEVEKTDYEPDEDRLRKEDKRKKDNMKVGCYNMIL